MKEGWGGGFLDWYSEGMGRGLMQLEFQKLGGVLALNFQSGKMEKLILLLLL